MNTKSRQIHATVRKASLQDAAFIIGMRRAHFEEAGRRYYESHPDITWYIAEFEQGPIGCLGVISSPVTAEIFGTDLYRVKGDAGVAALRAMHAFVSELCEREESDFLTSVPFANERMVSALTKAGFEPDAIVVRRRPRMVNSSQKTAP